MCQGARVREYFSDPFGRETVRAFVLFGLLLSIISGVGVRLVFQDLSRMALAHLHDLGVEEARRIAESVAALGRDARGIDVQRLREKMLKLRGPGGLEAAYDEMLKEADPHIELFAGAASIDAA